MGDKWCAQATFTRGDAVLVASVALQGQRSKLEEILGLFAQSNDLTLTELSTPQDARRASLNLSKALINALEGAPAALGPLAYSNASGPDLDAPVINTELTGIAPLDRQFGVWPPLSVPKSLHHLVLGQTGEAIPLGSFALLDGAQCPGLAERLDASGLEHRCLFTGKAQEDYADNAPWIVRIEDDNSFTRALFTSDIKDEIGTILWDRQPFVLLRSQVSLEGLWRHFRKFTQVVDEVTGKQVFFRFYAPETLRTLIVHMAQDDLQEFAQGCTLLAGPGLSENMIVVHRETFPLEV